MAEKMTNNTKGRPNPNKDKDNKSNTIRSVLFTLIMACLIAMLVASFVQNNDNGTKKDEVAISDVIQRANDPNGNISKITVTGNNLDITLKGEENPTETSRKDALRSGVSKSL